MDLWVLMLGKTGTAGLLGVYGPLMIHILAVDDKVYLDFGDITKNNIAYC